MTAFRQSAFSRHRRGGLRRCLSLPVAAMLLGACTAPMTAPEPLQNTIRWTTASEIENFGYDVYRADSKDGPFQRLTSQPIAGAGTTDDVRDYVFVDASIEAGAVYYYYVESISLRGERERFTPVFASTPKYPD